jgi:transposase-like protein
MMSREERIKHWRRIIEKHAASGLSAATFCRDNNIRISQFHRWRRRFRKEYSQGNESGFLQLVPFSKPVQHSGIRIRLRDDLSIEVDPGFDPHTLRGVIETIGGGETKPCSR